MRRLTGVGLGHARPCRHPWQLQSADQGSPKRPDFDLAFSINSRLEAEYANCPNIAFVRTQIPHAELAQTCVLGLTVRETPGLKMVAEGLPTLLAGHWTYSVLGLAPGRQACEELLRPYRACRSNVPTKNA